MLITITIIIKKNSLTRLLLNKFDNTSGSSGCRALGIRVSRNGLEWHFLMQLRKFDSSLSEGAGTDDSLTVVVGILEN